MLTDAGCDLDTSGSRISRDGRHQRRQKTKKNRTVNDRVALQKEGNRMAASMIILKSKNRFCKQAIYERN